MPDAGRVIDYNRFLYVRGNPLKYTDPSGHCPPCVWLLIAALILGGSTAQEPAGPYSNVPDNDNGRLAVSILPVVGDANDLGAVIFGHDVIMGADVPHFSAAWWLSVGATVLPVLPGKVARAAVGLGAEGGSKLASEAAENSPDGLKYMARGMKNEKWVLEELGYVKNTKTFTAVIDSGPYNTIPDIVDASNNMVGEIKNVQRLGWTKQLRAQFAVAEEMGYRYVLFIRSDPCCAVILLKPYTRDAS